METYSAVFSDYHSCQLPGLSGYHRNARTLPAGGVPVSGAEFIAKTSGKSSEFEGEMWGQR